MTRRRIAIYVWVATLAACSSRNAPLLKPPPATPAIMTAALHGLGLGRFHYVGHWEFVHGLHDGRWSGQSARSYHLGDSVSVAFKGRGIRIYGVTGPGGGYGTVGLDDRIHSDAINFYSPHKVPHALVYQSPRLPEGIHAIAMMVSGDHDRRSHGTYVNVESAEVVEVPR
jgi:hypothetical protein